MAGDDFNSPRYTRETRDRSNFQLAKRRKKDLFYLKIKRMAFHGKLERFLRRFLPSRKCEKMDTLIAGKQINQFTPNEVILRRERNKGID